MSGIILARDASLQFRHGAFTDPQAGYNKLQQGDLVFFGKKAEGDRPAKATHVGLYLGNGEYINSSGYVRTDSFDPTHKNFSKARLDGWLGGRTILGSEGVKGIVRVKDHPWY
jgi:cell wall-associated NlpC family hydrolase